MITTRGPLHAFLDYPEVPVFNAEAGPLADATLAVKDIFDVAGYPTGGGNPHRLEEGGIAHQTAPAVQLILEAGARFVGKTQTDELTYSLMGMNAHYPHPVNSAAPDRVTGGSSSGSAAAIAGRVADIATASDTGGSVRAPASFCGLIGLRTTHGRISLSHTMGLAPSFDTFGWFARDMALYRRVGDVLLGNDARRVNLRRPIRLAALDALVLGPAEAGEYRRMVDAVSAVTGAPAVVGPLTHAVDDLYWCFRKLQAHEAWDLHGPWISAKERGLGPGVKERFAFGSTIDASAQQAEAARRASFRAEFAALMGDDGILVLPTVPGAAPLKDASFDTMQAYRERALRLLCLSGLSGYPQLTLPLGTVEGAPFGISLLGPAGSDKALLALGETIMGAAAGA